MSKNTINEMKSMLSKMDEKKTRKRLTVESLINDDEDVYAEEDFDVQSEEPVTPAEFGEKEEDATEDVADIRDVIKNIRLQVLDGLRKIAEHPETEEYDTLKRILTICDKPAEQGRKQKNEQ